MGELKEARGRTHHEDERDSHIHPVLLNERLFRRRDDRLARRRVHGRWSSQDQSRSGQDAKGEEEGRVMVEGEVQRSTEESQEQKGRAAENGKSPKGTRTGSGSGLRTP